MRHLSPEAEQVVAARYDEIRAEAYAEAPGVVRQAAPGRRRADARQAARKLFAD
jgi:hypothetical protein